MKTRPVLPLVLSMSLPMVVSMMVASLYNIVDSYYVAKISEDAMMALSLVFPVQNLINAVTIGFSIGANAVISYHLGAQEHQKANAAATQSIVYNAIHGIILTIGCIAVMPSFLRLFTTDVQVIDMGVRYSRIAFAFAVFVAISMSMEKIFQAVGKMMMTMICMMSGCIANIILDPILIFGWGPFPKMGIEGAALATGIGQTLSLAIYIICYFAGHFPVHLCFTANTFNTHLPPQNVFCRHPCNPESCTPFLVDFVFEHYLICLFAGLCFGFRCVLQTANFPISARKWNCARYASYHRIQFWCKRIWASRKNISCSTCTFCLHHGSWHHSVLANAKSVDRLVLH